MWSTLQPGAFGTEYQLLIPLILATVGVMGGGTVGLIVGAIAPGRGGLALTLVGLIPIQMAAGVYFGSGVFALIIIPTAVINSTLALLCCLLRRKRVRAR
jgi:hypothetical protein